MRNREKNKPVKILNQGISLRQDTELVVSINKAKGIISWGWNNQYGEYLRLLYKGQPQHAGIVKGKARYLTGTDISGTTPQGDEWLSRANPKESWQCLRKKYIEDYTLYGGYSIKIIPNLLGVPLWYFQVDYGKLRPSINEQEVIYCDDWSNSWEDRTAYPIWYPGCKEIAIYIYRNYNPTLKQIESNFAGIEYESGIKSIDTLKRVQNFKNSLVANNFSSGTVITIFGGKPETKAEEDYLVNRIKGEHTGDEKAGNVVILFTDEEGKGAEIKSIDVNDLDKQFEGVTKSETINVFAAHNVPPDLFNYISDTATVFDVNKIVEQNQLFMNSYVIPTQEPELCMLQDFYNLRTGLEEDFEIEQFKPIGKVLPLENANVFTTLNAKDPNILVNYLSDEFGLNIPKAIAPNGQPLITGSPAPIAQVNEHLKNLNGRQMQGIDRIVRKFKSGTYSQIQASMLLKSGFGLTDQDAAQFLGQPTVIKQRIEFAKEIDFFAFMDANAHESSNDEVLEINFVGHNVQFSAWQFADDSANRSAILSKIKENPDLTNEEIASALGVSAAAVATAIAWLIAKKLLTKTDNGFDLTSKGKSAKKTTIYTEYNYGKRPDIDGPAIISTTRDFCKKLFAKYGPGMKALTYAVIDGMTNQFGMNVWDFRGGFYNDPKTHQTEPYCRHGWFGTTKIKYDNG